MEKLDYKKEYKDLYMPKTKPILVDVPNMKFIMIKVKEIQMKKMENIKKLYQYYMVYLLQ